MTSNIISGDSKQRVIDAWTTFASRDADRIAALFTEDAEWIAPAGNATAVALNGPSHMTGRAAISEFLATGFRKLFMEDVKIDFQGFHADGDVVVVRERMTATLANGRPYENEYCFVFTLEGGLIKQVKEYMDTLKGYRMIFGE